ncbi:TonB-dependent receptor, partial [Steroidobacter sp.]|uniref:TonB-dependent receptor n=1 Tax=Steroidobacter sp. TaxID=1978227 RepID=UPI001A3A9450
FGNSSLGGAVRTIPVAPKLNAAEGKVGVGYSVTSGTGGDNTMVQATGNLPLIEDRLALRASGYRFENSGFYRNRAGSDAAFRSELSNYDAEAFAADQDEVGTARFQGGRLAALLQASDALKLTVTLVKQQTEMDGEGRAETGLYDQSIAQVAPQHVRRGEHGGIYDTDIELANFVAEYELGWGSVLATVSHIESDTDSTSSSSSGFPDAYSSSELSNHRETSGELRIATRFDGAWNVLAGVYAEELDDRYFNDYYWFGSPETNVYGDDINLGEYLDRRKLKQKAGFAEVSWRPVPRLTITGGARAYDYDRTGTVNSTGALLGDVSTRRDAQASGASYRGNVSFSLREDAMVYAGWSQGFRLGKPQSGLPAGRCDVNGDGIVDGTSVRMADTLNTRSDELDSLELGGKFMLLDRRLSLSGAVYRIDWTGVPFRTRAPCGLAYNANAGGAISEGVEFQANAYVTKALRIDIGASSVRAKLTEDVPAQNAFKGDRLPGSPRVNANLGVQYALSIAGYEGYVRADSIYVGSFYGDLLESAQTQAGDYIKVDASARLTIAQMDIDLYVRNLTNEDAFTWRGLRPLGFDYFGYRLQPRTIGMQLMYRF